MQGFTLRGLCFTAAALSLVSLQGCTKKGSESDSGSNGGGNSNGEATLQCGVVTDGQLVNPVDVGDGLFVRIVRIESNNLVIVAENGDASKQFLVKIQGIDSAADAFRSQNAVNLIQSLGSGGFYFFVAQPDCQTSVDGGGRAAIGSLLTPTGQSVAEELVKQDFSPVDKNDACRGNLIGSCLEAIAEDTDDTTFAEIGCGFLYKPTSDSDGNLVVLVDECNVIVRVNGVVGRDAGAGNGRCTTSRFNFPGCSAGPNATVELFDGVTGLPFSFPDGRTKLVLNGCQRFEIPCR